ncbi:MAG: hypothetical protein ACLP2P_08820 [Desulfobaccales bacterium]
MTSLFLFGSFGFFEGMARVLDLGSTMVMYNESSTPQEADIQALYSDWQAVGNDLENAMRSYGQEQKTV